MVRPTRPSFPAPSEPSLRRLGVGGNGGDRPLRAQLVVALVALLILIAVPLYLWRRPTGDANSGGASASASAALLLASALAEARLEAGVQEDRVELGAIQKVKCSASQRAKGQEGALCDELSFFETALSQAIVDNVGCAPQVASGGTINYVLQIDFRRRAVNVFPGASGSWKGPQAKRATQCVKRSLPSVDWDSIQHQYNYYMLAIMATYPDPNRVGKPGESTLFE